MKKNPDKYVYDNGFSKRHYICTSCGSKHLVQRIKQGQFSPPDYKCDDCGAISGSPKWEDIIETPKETPKKKKVAKLVLVSFMTRVIVDEDATDLEICRAAKPKLIAIIENDEIHDNLEEITDDEGLPYGEVKGDEKF